MAKDNFDVHKWNNQIKLEEVNIFESKVDNEIKNNILKYWNYTEKDFGLTGWSDYLDHNNGVYVQRADRPKANWIERFDSKVPKDFYSRMFDLLTSSSKTKANRLGLSYDNTGENWTESLSVQFHLWGLGPKASKAFKNNPYFESTSSSLADDRAFYQGIMIERSIPFNEKTKDLLIKTYNIELSDNNDDSDDDDTNHYRY